VSALLLQPGGFEGFNYMRRAYPRRDETYPGLAASTAASPRMAL
jgi:hypothetical protein